MLLSTPIPKSPTVHRTPLAICDRLRQLHLFTPLHNILCHEETLLVLIENNHTPPWDDGDSTNLQYHGSSGGKDTAMLSSSYGRVLKHFYHQALSLATSRPKGSSDPIGSPPNSSMINEKRTELKLFVSAFIRYCHRIVPSMVTHPNASSGLGASRNDQWINTAYDISPPYGGFRGGTALGSFQTTTGIGRPWSVDEALHSQSHPGESMPIHERYTPRQLQSTARSHLATALAAEDDSSCTYCSTDNQPMSATCNKQNNLLLMTSLRLFILPLPPPMVDAAEDKKLDGGKAGKATATTTGAGRIASGTANADAVKSTSIPQSSSSCGFQWILLNSILRCSMTPYPPPPPTPSQARHQAATRKSHKKAQDSHGTNSNAPATASGATHSQNTNGVAVITPPPESVLSLYTAKDYLKQKGNQASFVHSLLAKYHLENSSNQALSPLSPVKNPHTSLSFSDEQTWTSLLARDLHPTQITVYSRENALFLYYVLTSHIQCREDRSAKQLLYETQVDIMFAPKFDSPAHLVDTKSLFIGANSHSGSTSVNSPHPNILSVSDRDDMKTGTTHSTSGGTEMLALGESPARQPAPPWQWERKKYIQLYSNGQLTLSSIVDDYYFLVQCTHVFDFTAAQGTGKDKPVTNSPHPIQSPSAGLSNDQHNLVPLALADSRQLANPTAAPTPALPGHGGPPLEGESIHCSPSSSDLKRQQYLRRFGTSQQSDLLSSLHNNNVDITTSHPPSPPLPSPGGTFASLDDCRDRLQGVIRFPPKPVLIFGGDVINKVDAMPQSTPDVTTPRNPSLFEASHVSDTTMRTPLALESFYSTTLSRIHWTEYNLPEVPSSADPPSNPQGVVHQQHHPLRTGHNANAITGIAEDEPTAREVIPSSAVKHQPCSTYTVFVYGDTSSISSPRTIGSSSNTAGSTPGGPVTTSKYLKNIINYYQFASPYLPSSYAQYVTHQHQTTYQQQSILDLTQTTATTTTATGSILSGIGDDSNSTSSGTRLTNRRLSQGTEAGSALSPSKISSDSAHYRTKQFTSAPKRVVITVPVSPSDAASDSSGRRATPHGAPRATTLQSGSTANKPDSYIKTHATVVKSCQPALGITLSVLSYHDPYHQPASMSSSPATGNSRKATKASGPRLTVVGKASLGGTQHSSNHLGGIARTTDRISSALAARYDRDSRQQQLDSLYTQQRRQQQYFIISIESVLGEMYLRVKKEETMFLYRMLELTIAPSPSLLLTRYQSPRLARAVHDVFSSVILPSHTLLQSSHHHALRHAQRKQHQTEQQPLLYPIIPSQLQDQAASPVGALSSTGSNSLYTTWLQSKTYVSHSAVLDEEVLRRILDIMTYTLTSYSQKLDDPWDSYFHGWSAAQYARDRMRKALASMGIDTCGTSALSSQTLPDGDASTMVGGQSEHMKEEETIGTLVFPPLPAVEGIDHQIDATGIAPDESGAALPTHSVSSDSSVNVLWRTRDEEETNEDITRDDALEPTMCIHFPWIENESTLENLDALLPTASISFLHIASESPLMNESTAADGHHDDSMYPYGMIVPASQGEASCPRSSRQPETDDRNDPPLFSFVIQFRSSSDVGYHSHPDRKGLLPSNNIQDVPTEESPKRDDLWRRLQELTVQSETPHGKLLPQPRLSTLQKQRVCQTNTQASNPITKRFHPYFIDLMALLTWFERELATPCAVDDYDYHFTLEEYGIWNIPKILPLYFPPEQSTKPATSRKGIGVKSNKTPTGRLSSKGRGSTKDLGVNKTRKPPKATSVSSSQTSRSAKDLPTPIAPSLYDIATAGIAQENEIKPDTRSSQGTATDLTTTNTVAQLRDVYNHHYSYTLQKSESQQQYQQQPITPFRVPYQFLESLYRRYEHDNPSSGLQPPSLLESSLAALLPAPQSDLPMSDALLRVESVPQQHQSSNTLDNKIDAVTYTNDINDPETLVTCYKTELFKELSRPTAQRELDEFCDAQALKELSLRHPSLYRDYILQSKEPLSKQVTTPPCQYLTNIINTVAPEFMSSTHTAVSGASSATARTTTNQQRDDARPAASRELHSSLLMKSSLAATIPSYLVFPAVVGLPSPSPTSSNGFFHIGYNTTSTHSTVCHVEIPPAQPFGVYSSPDQLPPAQSDLYLQGYSSPWLPLQLIAASVLVRQAQEVVQSVLIVAADTGIASSGGDVDYIPPWLLQNATRITHGVYADGTYIYFLNSGKTHNRYASHPCHDMVVQRYQHTQVTKLFLAQLSMRAYRMSLALERIVWLHLYMRAYPRSPDPSSSSSSSNPRPESSGMSDIADTNSSKDIGIAPIHDSAGIQPNTPQAPTYDDLGGESLQTSFTPNPLSLIETSPQQELGEHSTIPSMESEVYQDSSCTGGDIEAPIECKSADSLAWDPPPVNESAEKVISLSSYDANGAFVHPPSDMAPPSYSNSCISSVPQSREHVYHTMHGYACGNSSQSGYDQDQAPRGSVASIDHVSCADHPNNIGFIPRPDLLQQHTVPWDHTTAMNSPHQSGYNGMQPSHHNHQVLQPHENLHHHHSNQEIRMLQHQQQHQQVHMQQYQQASSSHVNLQQYYPSNSSAPNIHKIQDPQGTTQSPTPGAPPPHMRISSRRRCHSMDEQPPVYPPSSYYINLNPSVHPHSSLAPTDHSYHTTENTIKTSHQPCLPSTRLAQQHPDDMQIIYPTLPDADIRPSSQPHVYEDVQHAHHQYQSQQRESRGALDTHPFQARQMTRASVESSPSNGQEQQRSHTQDTSGSFDQVGALSLLYQNAPQLEPSTHRAPPPSRAASSAGSSRTDTVSRSDKYLAHVFLK